STGRNVWEPSRNCTSRPRKWSSTPQIEWLAQALKDRVLLDRLADLEIRSLGVILRLLIGLYVPVPVEHPMTIGAGMKVLRTFDFSDQLRRNLKSAPRAHSPFDCSQCLILPGCFELRIAGKETRFNVGRSILLLRFKTSKLFR